MEGEDEEEEKEVGKKGPKFPIQMYITEGNKYLRLGKYDLAVEFFNKGLEKDPINRRCLIGRSKCYMRLAKYDEAREDAEAVMKAYPKSPDAKMLIGEADFFLGDFEKAFLTYHLGHSSRMNHIGLRCGHQMCRKAIDNALNPDIPIVIDDEDVQNLQKLKEDYDAGEMREQKAAQGQFSKDIYFVTSILNDDTKASVHPDCEYLKEYLRERKAFWRTQNPVTSKESKTESAAENDKGKAENVTRTSDSHEAEDNISRSEPIDEK